VDQSSKSRDATCGVEENLALLAIIRCLIELQVLSFTEERLRDEQGGIVVALDENRAGFDIKEENSLDRRIDHRVFT
jgi:hypothetical protein